jgi:hypothetical protein
LAAGRTGIAIWDMATSALLVPREDQTVPWHYFLRGRVHSLDFQPGTQALAACDDAGTIIMADLNTRKVTRAWHVEPVAKRPLIRGYVHFIKDGQYLAYVSESEDRIIVFDCMTGKQVREDGMPLGSLFGHSFSPDGTLLAIRSEDDNATISIIDVLSRIEVHRLFGHTKSVVHISYSADGRSLLSYANDNTLRMWELSTSSERLQVRVPPNEVDFVCMTGGGTYLITAGRRRSGACAWELCQCAGNESFDRNSVCDASSLFRRLAKADAPDAYHAMVRMLASPSTSLAFLSQQVKPVRDADSAFICAMVRDLASENPQVRDASTKELDKVADLGENILRDSLKKDPDPEQRRRIELLLADLAAWANPERIQALRMIEVLESIGSKDARAALAMLASGAPAAWITREAKRSLARLTMRHGE